MQELKGIQAEDLISIKESNELFNWTIPTTYPHGTELILVPLSPFQSSLQQSIIRYLRS
jgi:hypothetical protein